MNTEPTPSPVCSRCRTPIPVDAPVPFCPPCLAQLAEESRSSGPNWRAVILAVVAILFVLLLVILSVLHPQALEKPSTPDSPATTTNTTRDPSTNHPTAGQTPVPQHP